MIAGGCFTKANINVPEDVICTSQAPPDYIRLVNRTAWGDANRQAAVNIIHEWYRDMAQGTALPTAMVNGTFILSANTQLLTDGISCYDTVNPPTYAALATTAITAANPAVCTMANTGTIALGDTVRIYGATGMQQISGMDFNVVAITPNVSISLSLNAAGYAAPATAGQVVKIIPNMMYPRWRWIASITQAANAVVMFTHLHDYSVGERVSFRVPAQFGMTQLNNVSATVVAVGAFTITINTDTSLFTAFAFPTSAIAAAGIRSAVCVPSASGVIPAANPPAMNINDAFDNRNVRVIHFGATIFNIVNFCSTNGDIFEWTAHKFDQYNNT
jgi:hypothetical protein